MIGIDTNVLLRLVVEDDDHQSQLARTLLTNTERSGERARIDRVVLVEALWVLRSRYRQTSPQIAAFLSSLLSSRTFALEDRDLVEAALATSATTRAGVADVLIGLTNRRAGCRATYSFDRKTTALETFLPVPDA